MTIGLVYHLTMKELPSELRPRERLLASGVAGLSDAELLAIILGSGRSGETALELAQRMLAEGKGLRFLAEKKLMELISVEGIGPAKAARLKAAVEIGRRLAAGQPLERTTIRTPSDVAGLLMEEMRYLDREHFRALSLNIKNQVLAIEQVSIGGLNSSPVHPRELFKDPLKRGAAALVLVHNHPSGDPTPSKEDFAVTRRLAEAGKILGIEVLDHVILGDNRFVSLKEEGVF